MELEYEFDAEDIMSILSTYTVGNTLLEWFFDFPHDFNFDSILNMPEYDVSPPIDIEYCFSEDFIQKLYSDLDLFPTLYENHAPIPKNIDERSAGQESQAYNEENENLVPICLDYLLDGLPPILGPALNICRDALDRWNLAMTTPNSFCLANCMSHANIAYQKAIGKSDESESKILKKDLNPLCALREVYFYEVQKIIPRGPIEPETWQLYCVLWMLDFLGQHVRVCWDGYKYEGELDWIQWDVLEGKISFGGLEGDRGRWHDLKF
jgi:hypothetical protein